MNASVINHILPRVIPALAERLEAVTGVIDVFGAMGGAALAAPELFCNYQSCDVCHPNDAGYDALAGAVFRALFFRPRLARLGWAWGEALADDDDKEDVPRSPNTYVTVSPRTFSMKEVFMLGTIIAAFTTLVQTLAFSIAYKNLKDDGGRRMPAYSGVPAQDDGSADVEMV